MGFKFNPITGQLDLVGSGSSGPGGPSPLTTKGDVFAFSTTDDRLPVGTDGQLLVADSNESTGLRWADPTADDQAANEVSYDDTGNFYFTGTNVQDALDGGEGSISSVYGLMSTKLEVVAGDPAPMLGGNLDGDGHSIINVSLLEVADDAYGAGWDSSTEVPTKNALYDKIETLGGGGFVWTVVTGTSQSAAVNNGYITNNASLVTVTIPTTAAVGDTIEVGGMGAGGWKVAQNASEIIHFGNTTTTTGTGGSLASTHRRDTVRLVCIVADTEWLVLSSVGNITVV